MRDYQPSLILSKASTVRIAIMSNTKEKSENVDNEGENVELDYDKETSKGEVCVKIICLGDSAVGKSKLVERFLIDGFKPQQLSTYALSLYRHRTTVNDEKALIDIWDTAGQERTVSMAENMDVTKKNFAFCSKNNMPLYYVSASDGTNVVKMFYDCIEKAVQYKKNPVDLEDQIMEELERM